MTDKNEPRERLKAIQKKAEQQATAHAWLRDRFDLVNSALSIVSLVASVFLLAIVMATPDAIEKFFGISALHYQWITALLAASSFSMVVVQLSWKPDAKGARHELAVKHYARAIYAIRALRQKEGAIAEADVALIIDQYLENRDLPSIPERRFLALKKWHLMKVTMSTSLDNDPFESLRSIRARLKSKGKQREPPP